VDIQTEISQTLKDIEGLSPSGYAMALHVKFNAPDFLFQTYSEDWINKYNLNGYVMLDPTVRWGFENTGLIRWSELADQDDAGVMKQAAEHGLKYGFAYVLDIDESRSLCSFARPDREFSDAEISVICPMAEAVHRATAKAGALNDATFAELKRLSIKVTRPGTA